MNKESVIPITITPQWGGSTYPEAYAVYIDWNNDGDFADANETAFTKAASTVTPATGSITIPANAPYLGNVRMRVSMQYNALPSSCGSFTYGQVEDYTLNVKEKLLAVSELNNNATTIYPNPVKDVIIIQSKVSGELSYKIYSTTGQVVSKGLSVDKKINAEKLNVGNYIIEFTDKDGNKTTSKFIKK